MTNKIATLDGRVYWFACIAFGAIMGYVLSSHYGVRCNLSTSFLEDYFITKKHFNQLELQNGTIIITRVDFDNPYIAKGKLLIKKIACNSGDTLETKEKDFYCNGNLIAVAKEKDSKNRTIEQFHFNGKIPDGYVFLVGENPMSYDSRYFGLSKKANIEEVGLWSF